MMPSTTSMETVLVKKKDIEIRSFASLPDPVCGAPNYPGY
jgi:hypothetical protein